MAAHKADALSQQLGAGCLRDKRWSQHLVEKTFCFGIFVLISQHTNKLLQISQSFGVLISLLSRDGQRLASTDSASGHLCWAPSTKPSSRSVCMDALSPPTPRLRHKGRVWR